MLKDQYHSRQVGAFFLLLLIVPIFIYWNGLPGAFLVDDVQHLSLLSERGGVSSWHSFQAFVFGNHSGPLGRPISMLSFLLNDQAFPGDASDYRFTNLMIHCLCGVMLFVFSSCFLAALGKKENETYWISLAVSACWLVIPLNISTTLYVIQRMTQLSTLFVLVGLIFYLKGRERILANDRSGWMWVIVGLFGAGGLAVLSKESGALIFVYALACEVALIVANPGKLTRIMIVLLVAPILILFLHFLMSWKGFSAGYEYRPFTPIERLLTESRVLWDYFRKLFIPTGAKWGLVNDDLVLSRSLFSPWSTFFAVLGHCLVIVVAVLMRRKAPLLLFAVMWFYGGHLLESTLIPLELYYEHRNYLPAAGILLSLMVFLCSVKKHAIAARLAVFAFLVMSAVISFQQTRLWGDPAAQVVSTAQHHPESVRAQTDLAGLLLSEKQYGVAQGLLEAMQEKWPTYLHIDLLLLKHQCQGHFSVVTGVREIVAKQSSAIYSGNLPAALEAVMNVYRERSCAELKPTAMLNLLEGFIGLPMSLPQIDSKLNYWRAEIYRDLGDLNGAMASLNNAKMFSNESLYWFTEALYLSSAGLYSEAEKYLATAIDIEMKKPFFKRSNLKVYENLMRSLVNHK